MERDIFKQLSFFEFLSAVNQEKTRAFLEDLSSCAPIPTPLHEKLLALLKVYFFVGGMPEAVAEYSKQEKLSVVREVQLEILDAYERDFAKHAPLHEVMNITTVWHQVHRQLAKETRSSFLQLFAKVLGEENMK